MSAQESLRLTLFALAGLVAGAASLGVLRLNARLYVGGSAWRSAALHLGRLAVVALALVWAARQGAWPLLAVAAGFTLARPIAMPLLARAR